MRENKILSSAALITKVFIFFIIFLNVKAEVVNKKYFKNEQGVLAIMYHRFEENKYPSTNIRLDIFKKHINLIKDAMFSSSNEPGGTSYRHRWENKKFTFAGKTGSSQIKRFTEAQREAEVKQES